MSIQATLNYWMNKKLFNATLLGFVGAVPEAHFALTVGEEHVCPLFLFQNSMGWGDGTPTSTKFSWVLYAKGTDDHSVYMLFGTKEGALNFAAKYLTGGCLINPFDDEYKGRKWNWQN
jgi:hypothetical protein